MKRLSFTITTLLVSISLFAGGLVTNTNHSAMFTRMQCRDAVIDVDAVYFNPAGVARLNSGLYVSLNNQTIGQTKTVGSDYLFLSDAPNSTYEGKVSAPIFPGIYAAFKTGKFAFSAGFNPIGGGGGAEFATGLPSFEMPMADIVPVLQGQLMPLDTTIASATGSDPMFRNISGYDADISFEGTSVYYGVQANVSYEVNRFLAVALGARYVSVKNTYLGHIRNVTIDAPEVYGGTQAPGTYLRTVAGTPGLDATTVATLNGTADLLDAQTTVEVDAEETGSGITPIVSVNITPIDRLNIALKYEHETAIELETKVNGGKDGGGMYTEGEKVKANMPAQIVAGVTFNPIDKLMLSSGVHYYLDKSTDLGGAEDILFDKNYIEYALGFDYKLTDKFTLGAGWLMTRTGVSDAYQSGLSYSLPSNTFGFGGAFALTDMLDLNLAGSYTVYEDGSVSYQYASPLAPTVLVNNVTETYAKDVWIVAVGLNLRLAR